MARGPTTEIQTRHITEYLFDDARESAAGDSRQILGRMAKGEQMERIQVSSGETAHFSIRSGLFGARNS
jgi:hypothetical protein